MAIIEKLLTLICSARRFGINDELVLNTMLNLRHVPLFLVKHFVIPFNSNGPKSNAPKKVPNFHHFAIFFGNPFPKNCLLPLEDVIIANSYLAKFMHDVRGPSPSSPSLNVVS